MTEPKNVRPSSGEPAMVDRRRLLGAAGAAAAASVPWSESHAAARGRWDHEADVVVVGSGAGGLSAAVIAATEGAKVLIVDAAPTMGGTTIRSGGGCWVPNNHHMRQAGLGDPRDAAIRYMARYAFPETFDPSDPQLGLTANAFALLEAFYDNAAPTFEKLEALGALYTRSEAAYDYWHDAPENKAPVGRTIFPTPPGAKQGVGAVHLATAVTPEWRELNAQLGGGSTGAGGPVMIGQFKAWLEARKTPVLLNHRVRRIVANRHGEVIGVEATKGDSDRVVTIRARRATHFASGGFTFNPELRRSFLTTPSYGGCAVPTSQGDFVYMATETGARLGNMQNGWGISLILDEALDDPHGIHSVWHLGGDSMFMVNKHGRRVVNEKLNYNDRNQIFSEYDPGAKEWRNQVLFLIFDQRVRDLCAGLYPFAPKGEAAPYILRSDTLEGLTPQIAAKLARYAPRTGGFKLADDFAPNLKETAQRFNRYAETGIDEEFGRGSHAYDLQWHMRALGQQLVATNDKLNKTLYPLSGQGPYYAVPIVRGNADTNGGPVINREAQVLSHRDQPIPGLYGAGNCIASPSGRAYWGGGTTLSLAITFGCRAGFNAAHEPVKAEA